jgi:CRP-like cAMP-binding protein
LKAKFKTTSAASKRPRVVRYGAGQLIFRLGDLGTDMYVINEGKVEVIREDPPGGGTVAVLEKGDFFGEMSVLEGVPRSASVKAISDVKLVRIDGTTFTSLLRAEPEIAVRIMRKLSRRLRESDRVIRSLRGEAVAKDAVSQEATAVDASPSISPRLTHRKSGSSFSFPPNETVAIGRRDPITGIQPEVDLSGVDPERSCSRQHAKIFPDGSRYLLVEDIGTTNGTFLNRTRLETGVPTEIRSGDELRFGLVTLDFEV